MRRRLAVAGVPARALLALVLAAPAAGQAPVPGELAGVPGLRIGRGVIPETVTVGDRFRAVLRVEVPGATVAFGPLAASDTLQPLDSVDVMHADPPTAVYTAVAWYPDAPLAATVPVRISFADGVSGTWLVPLRLPVVRSVLPSDTAGLQPRPARGVLAEPVLPPGPRLPWGLLLLFLLLLLLLGAGWLLRRGRRAVPPPAADPRELALRGLDELLERGWATPAERDRFYPAVTRLLRGFLAATDSRLGTDLTSTELVARVGAAPRTAHLAPPLAAALAHADRVKFAAVVPAPEEIRLFHQRVREVVGSFPEGADELEVAA